MELRISRKPRLDEKKISTRKFNQLLQLVPKDKTVTLRLPGELVVRFKDLAGKKKTKYQRLMREALIDFVGKAI